MQSDESIRNLLIYSFYHTMAHDLWQAERQLDRVMVTVSKTGIHNVHIGNIQIIGYNKAVHCQRETILSIGFIAIAAGRGSDTAGIVCQLIEMRRNHRIRKSRRPCILCRYFLVENLFGVADKIVIEITGSKDIVFFFVFLLHIGKQLA